MTSRGGCSDVSGTSKRFYVMTTLDHDDVITDVEDTTPTAAAAGDDEGETGRSRTEGDEEIQEADDDDDETVCQQSDNNTTSPTHQSAAAANHRHRHSSTVEQSTEPVSSRETGLFDRRLIDQLEAVTRTRRSIVTRRVGDVLKTTETTSRPQRSAVTNKLTSTIAGLCSRTYSRWLRSLL